MLVDVSGVLVKLPEWSKGSDLRSDVFVLVGSNPTFDIIINIYIFFILLFQYKKYSLFFIFK